MSEPDPTTTSEESAASSGAASAPPAVQPAIEARGLSKYYGQFTAIEGINFTVRPNAVTAFLGPNGAGKSTTIKILTGFLAPSAGTALMNGRDVSIDRLANSRQLGYLPENGPLYPEMTPSAFLRFAARTRGISGQTLAAGLKYVSEACQLGEVWHKPIRKLSKGFRQRVGLAQAILHDPSVLILDEPTSGLDPNQIELVRQLIRDLAKSKTVLLSTHILQEVEAIADDVIVISQGRVVFTGTPAELRGDGDIEQRFRALTGGHAA